LLSVPYYAGPETEPVAVLQQFDVSPSALCMTETKPSCTNEKEKKIFLIYKEIHIGAVAKYIYMRKAFLIYEEMHI
jgi:hypothetical protein